VPAGRIEVGVCIDPTASSSARFAEGVRDALATAVAGLASPSGPVPTYRVDGATGPVVEPSPGVGVWVAQVTTVPLDTDPSAHSPFRVEVPAVPGLLDAAPDLNATTEVQQQRWRRDYETVTAARDRARTAAADASARLRGMRLARGDDVQSGVSGCMSALAGLVPAADRREFLIASDLAENVHPQLAGGLDGAPVVVLQACPEGDAGRCARRLREFRARMRTLHAGEVTTLQPALAGDVLRDLLTAGAVG